MRRDHLLLLGALLTSACNDAAVVLRPRVQGAGEAPPLGVETRTEVIDRLPVAKVDVLWVIDDSCSMSEEQAKLADNLAAFFDVLDGIGLDWHTAVVSTDPNRGQGEQGTLHSVAGYRFLAPEIPQARDLFSILVRVGIDGGEEVGLHTAQQALFPSTPRQIEAARGFLRPSAALHVIAISDEDDRSLTDEDPSTDISPFELADQLRTLKEDPDTPVTFNSIVGPAPNGCQNRENTAEAGYRYLEVTQAVGGIAESICKSDWAPVLEALGLQAAGVRREYFLSERPAPGTLRVRFVTPDNVWEGVEVADTAESQAACEAAGALPLCFGWIYNSQRNAITTVGTIPEGRARLRVDYELLGGTRDIAEDTAVAQ